MICNNCQNTGHLYYNCKKPVTSLGIICYRYNPNCDEIEYLMVQRKDSLGFVDLMRGKYNEDNLFLLKNIIYGITDNEIDLILNSSYEELWKYLGYNLASCDIKNEIKLEKIKSLKQNIFKKEGWKTPEWGFPKGRRNFKESDLEAAVREFVEETGYNFNYVDIIKNIFPLEELFTGTNLKSYKHKYFIGKMDYDYSEINTIFQASEIGDMKWLNFQDALNIIRPYNYEKKQILKDTHYIINNLVDG